ncbi:MAG: flippase-like domain-containing protein [Candidatus Methylomirabilis oxyfera]|nr:flippase-like domain-containing protein [Candidatus Methylomirabilis oxyfera]
MTTLPAGPKGAPWRFWLKLLVSLALLAFLFSRTDLPAIWALFRSLRLPLLLSSVVLYLLAQILSTLRWRCLLQAEQINLSTWRLMLLYFEGMFFNLMLPTVIGGDVVRGYQIFRLTEQKESSLASILVERLSGYVALIMIACVALLLGYPYLRDPVTVWLIAASGAGIIGIIAGLLSDQLQMLLFKLLHRAGLGRFHETLQRFYGALQRYWKHRRALLQALGLSLILQSLLIIIFYLISRSLNLSVPLRSFFLFVPLISVVSMLPISVAGLGLREGSSVYFFAKVGLDSAGALSLSLLWFAVTACCSGLGGIVFLVGHPYPDTRP